ncbi:CU044_5270 family protein [Streptomyces diastatochromogenes]|nr:CU044_5270 family protein [Streptomyces diastatochromogenes]
MNASAPRPPHADADELLRTELTELLPPPPVPDLTAERNLHLRHSVLRTALAAGDGAPARPVRARRPRQGSGSAGSPRRWPPARSSPVSPCSRPRTCRAAPRPHPGRAARPVRGRTGAVRGRARRAAAPAPNVRPGEYVYVKSLVAHAGRDAAGGPAALPPAHQRECGSPRRQPAGAAARAGCRRHGTRRRGARVRTGPSRGHAPEDHHGGGAALRHEPDPRVRGCASHGSGRAAAPGPGPDAHGRGDADQRAFTAIGTLLAETWAPPKVTAALYEAAARIPGVTVLSSAKDAAGREGVAVARTSHGEQTQWIFDRATSAFLGERTVLTGTTSAGRAGTVLGVSAVLVKAAAPAPGELPKG